MKGDRTMKKLTKANVTKRDTIEAYTCVCSCGCGTCTGCGCAAGVVNLADPQANAFSAVYNPAQSSGAKNGYIK